MNPSSGIFNNNADLITHHRSCLGPESLIIVPRFCRSIRIPRRDIITSVLCESASLCLRLLRIQLLAELALPLRCFGPFLHGSGQPYVDWSTSVVHATKLDIGLVLITARQ